MGIGIVIEIMLAIVIPSSKRNRVKQRTAQQNGYKRYELYVTTNNPFWSKGENKIIPTQKIDQSTNNELFFCNYCRMKLEEKRSFCTNCGHKRI